jgi:hypothetical protein
VQRRKRRFPTLPPISHAGICGGWSWMIDHPSWIIDHPSWIIDHPSWIIDHPSWIVDHQD